MRLHKMRFTFIAAIALLAASAHAAPDPALEKAVSSPDRSASAIARDKARHPVEELTFFGIKPTSTVVELWPGGGYWTDILGPYLAKEGHYYVAQPVGDKEEDAGAKKLSAHIAEHKERFGKVTETALGVGHFDIAPPGSADFVLTFRNLHNWMGAGYADQAMAAAFKALKPGGVLGIEEHRGRNDKDQDPKGEDGYVRQDYTIAMAKKAGFELAGSSEINANPKDTKNWPDGVWSLPPTLAGGDKDREKFLAIGEADNFVLKFRKPK
jgi:predicted methyltransferase